MTVCMVIFFCLKYRTYIVQHVYIYIYFFFFLAHPTNIHPMALTWTYHSTHLKKPHHSPRTECAQRWSGYCWSGTTRLLRGAPMHRRPGPWWQAPSTSAQHSEQTPMPLRRQNGVYQTGWWFLRRVGQNRMSAPYMTVCMVISLPKIPYVHRIYL